MNMSQLAIRRAWETGHFWSPDNPEGLNVKESDLDKLSTSDPVVVAALISLSKVEARRFAKYSLEESGNVPEFDGRVTPAMEKLVVAGRCPVPDYAPPEGVQFTFEDPYLQQVVERMQGAEKAIGSGNWKGCHGIGNFHSAIIRVNPSGLPEFLRPVWSQVLTNVRQAYAEVGLLWSFVDKNGIDLLTGKPTEGNVQIDMSFVGSSSGWIGLAIVGQNESCNSSPIWCRFLNTYRGGSSEASIVTQWTTLLKHELGHNCGRNHTSGGVMNPSLVNGLPVSWVDSDPSTSWLKQQFGGVLVPIPGGGPETPTPTPPISQAVVDAVQDAKISYLLQQTSSLSNRLTKLEVK